MKIENNGIASLRPRLTFILVVCALMFGGAAYTSKSHTTAFPQTAVTISQNRFLINGKPTYEGRSWQGRRIEGLLMNSRMVQGIFDDINPETSKRWAYPDTGVWDPERNVTEFIAAMPEWRKHGLLAFTVNLQGGSPEGYSKTQPWHNSAYLSDGRLRPEYQARLKRILDRADQLGMVVIVGYFYFGQDGRLADESSVLRAVDDTTLWLLNGGWRNVLVEIDNECDGNYHHPILKAGRVRELVRRVKQISYEGRRFPVSVSYRGNVLPGEEIVDAVDFILLHGNGVKEPKRIAEMVRQTRAIPSYSPKPILFNEDDHFDFDHSENNFVAAVGEYASWGYFDYRMSGEGLNEGFQSVPVNWNLSSERKRSFFQLLAEVTGSRLN